MKKIIIIISLILIPISPTFSATLKEALIQAYNNNTELNAERENLNISKEELNISKSNYLPSVTLSGSKSKEETNKLTNQSGGDATITDVDPTTTSIKLEQTIIDTLLIEAENKNTLTVNLEDQKIVLNNNEEYNFDIDVFRKKCLIEGLDDIGLTLQKKEKIDNFEDRLHDSKPWII